MALHRPTSRQGRSPARARAKAARCVPATPRARPGTPTRSQHGAQEPVTHSFTMHLHRPGHPVPAFELTEGSDLLNLPNPRLRLPRVRSEPWFRSPRRLMMFGGCAFVICLVVAISTSTASTPSSPPPADPAPPVDLITELMTHHGAQNLVTITELMNSTEYKEDKQDKDYVECDYMFDGCRIRKLLRLLMMA